MSFGKGINAPGYPDKTAHRQQQVNSAACVTCQDGCPGLYSGQIFHSRQGGSLPAALWENNCGFPERLPWITHFNIMGTAVGAAGIDRIGQGNFPP